LHAFVGNQNLFSYPRVMGHELAVEVLEIGATERVLDYAAGDQCCVIPYLNCGACVACRRGKSNCCTNMQVLGVHIDGGMREQFTLPVDKLLRADGVAVEQLALVEMLCIGARAAERARIMVKESLDAFVKMDSALARKVIQDDDFIDNLTEQLFRELLSFMIENPKTISRAIRLSFISKYIERIADHATNVAELVVYMVEGKIIRHTVPPQEG